jgi:hypothetical protein
MPAKQLVSFDLRLAHIPAANFGTCLDASVEEAKMPNGNAIVARSSNSGAKN